MTRRTELPLLAAAIFVGAVGIGGALNYVNQPRTVEAAAASPLVIHLQPGEQVTIVADPPSTEPSPVATSTAAGPTPSLTAPTCSVSIQGTDVWVSATGLKAGELYAVWWHVQKPDGTTYDASGNEIPAKADGTWRFVYDLTPGHTEVYVYRKAFDSTGRDIAYGDPSAAVAECEYDA